MRKHTVFEGIEKDGLPKFLLINWSTRSRMIIASYSTCQPTPDLPKQRWYCPGRHD